MFLLHKRLNDSIEVDGETYVVNASFDTILTVLDVWQDKEYSDLAKAGVALMLLVGERFDYKEPNERIDLAVEILGKYISFEEEERYTTDLLGNVMEAPPAEEREALMSMKYDAERIFASFWQAYRIDLIEEQGRLHWKKFKILLDYLPFETPLKHAMYVRGWTPSDDKRKKRDAMREEKRRIALPDEYR